MCFTELTLILFQEDFFVWKKLTVHGQQGATQCARMRTHLAFEQGWLPRDAVIAESLLGFKRAGCDGILTYFALDAARWLQETNS